MLEVGQESYLGLHILKRLIALCVPCVSFLHDVPIDNNTMRKILILIL